MGAWPVRVSFWGIGTHQASTLIVHSLSAHSLLLLAHVSQQEGGSATTIPSENRYTFKHGQNLHSNYVILQIGQSFYSKTTFEMFYIWLKFSHSNPASILA